MSNPVLTARRDGIDFPVLPSDLRHIEPHTRTETAWRFLTNATPRVPTTAEVAELVRDVIERADSLVVRWLELYADTRLRRNRTWVQLGSNGLAVVCVIERGEGSVATAYIPHRAAQIADAALRHAAAVRDLVERYLEYRDIPGVGGGFGFHSAEVVSKIVWRKEGRLDVRVVMRDIRFEDLERWGFRAVGEWWVFDPLTVTTPPVITLRPRK